MPRYSLSEAWQTTLDESEAAPPWCQQLVGRAQWSCRLLLGGAPTWLGRPMDCVLKSMPNRHHAERVFRTLLGIL
jgi:hypothetical protein